MLPSRTVSCRSISREYFEPLFEQYGYVISSPAEVFGALLKNNESKLKIPFLGDYEVAYGSNMSLKYKIGNVAL